MLIVNKLPKPKEYSVYPSFLNQEDIDFVINSLPELKEWNIFSSGETIRYEAPFISDTNNVEVFNKIKKLLNVLHLKLYYPIIRPRLYKIGNFFDWHYDHNHTPDIGGIQYECILTLKNTSDSVTKFKLDNNTEESYSSQSGDLVIMCRNGLKHRVEPLTYGERLTLKFTAVKE